MGKEMDSYANVLIIQQMFLHLIPCGDTLGTASLSYILLLPNSAVCIFVPCTLSATRESHVKQPGLSGEWLWKPHPLCCTSSV
jgi:hypothetical protein